MTADEIKNLFKSYELHNSAIIEAQAQLEVIAREKAGVINKGKSVSNIDGMPRGNSVGDPTYLQVLSLIRYDRDEDNWQKVITRHQRKLAEIEKLLDKLEDEQQRWCVWTYYCKGEKLPVGDRVDKTLKIGRRRILKVLEQAVEGLCAKVHHNAP